MSKLMDSDLPGRIKENLKFFWRENRQFFFLLCCIVFFKSAIGDISSISGASMQPTLLDGDKVWLNKLAYDIKIPFTEISLASIADPKRGDIVVFDSKKAKKRLVKRIVGLPGDTILLQKNNLIINGQAVNYEIVTEDRNSMIIIEELPERSHKAQLSRNYISLSNRNYGPVDVPPDQYFVLGDNRDNSSDSRKYSFIPRGELIGRSSSVIFSLDPANRYMPRADRFFSGLD